MSTIHPDFNNDPYSPVGVYIQEILDCPKLSPQIACHRIVPGASPLYGENRLRWSSAITRLLDQKNCRLYSHQSLATDHVRAGHSIVCATPTASGKSLIYNLPVLETFLKDKDSRALYLFPLKALAQDQLQALNTLTASWPVDARPDAALYDGDTNDYQRRKIRANPPAALLTNPEMLHLSLLPYHEKWATFLCNLNYIIVDEAHTYRGIFGSHMAGVFRRLNRITSHYGASPTYIFCTATLGNPKELASNLRDGETVLINKSGAPQGCRHFMFINPEMAASTCVIELLKKAMLQNLRSIVYCKSRRMTELISMWVREQAGPLSNRISAYRAGFLSEQRRGIEARMASGELLAVVSTSALELGIDIGGLDLCIMAGYPGTIMQTLQRGGRVGRAQRESAVIVVAEEDALDQYFMNHPEDFFNRPPEKAVINPDNEVIIARHLECAAAEMPLNVHDPWLAMPGAQAALATLHASGKINLSRDGNLWIANSDYPHRGIDLRGSGQSYHIEDENGDIIGVIDGFRALRETHPGAVYLHQGISYIVNAVDCGRMRIEVKKAKLDWFTRIRSRKVTDILEEYERISLGRCPAFRGKLRITETITGYEKRSSYGNKLLTVTPLEIPPQIFETEGMWLIIPDQIRKKLEDDFIHFMGSIHAMEHAIIGLLPLEVMADRNDFGGISIPLHPQLSYPAVFIYDSLPGGAGLTKAAFANCHHLLTMTENLINECACEDGCPSCIQSPKCGSGNRPLSKIGVSALLAELLAPGSEGDQIVKELVINTKFEQIKFTLPNVDVVSVTSEVKNINLCKSAISTDPPENYVVFDVETRRSAAEVGGWQNAHEMGVSVAVLYDSGEDKFFNYQEHELQEMFERMSKAALVIGFNSIRFDYRVLEPFEKCLHDFHLRQLPSLDLLQRIHKRLNYRVSLDNLGKATLNAPKTANGLQALKWWREGKISEIAAYCKSDVQLTRDLYLFGLQNNYLVYSNKRQDKIRVEVNFAPGC